MFYDLWRLYSLANEYAGELEEINAVLWAENSYQQQYIGSLEARISAGNMLVATPWEMTTIYPNAAQDAADATPRARVDREAGVVTLPLKGPAVSKLHYLDLAGNLVLPPLEYRLTGSGAMFEETPFLGIFQGRTWQRRIYSTQPEQVTVEVDFPGPLLTDMRTNSIFISPHPFRSLDLLSVELNLGRAGYQSAAGFVQQSQIPPLRLFFPVVEAVGVRLVLRQPSYLTLNEKQCYVLGLSGLGCYHETYMETGLVLSPFDIPFGASVISIVHRLDGQDYASPTDSFSFELWREEPDGTLAYLADWDDIPATRVWVKTVLSLGAKTPALSRVVLQYV